MTDAATITGEAIVYNAVARIGGMFDETIAPGAVTGFLKSSHVGEVALVRDHDPSILLARVRSGTLELNDSSAALRIRAKVADTTSGRETVEMVRRGDLYAMSFSFVMDPKDETWHEGPSGFPLRVIRRIRRMYDVSVVTWPAYSATSVGIEGPGVNGARMRLARQELAAAADVGATLERRVFGEALYGPRRRPTDAVLTYARSRRNKRITPLPKVA